MIQNMVLSGGAKMASKKTIEKMAMDLRRKYFVKSDGAIVAHDIMSDINNLKKFENLNSYEMAELFKQAVCMTDGEDIYATVLAEHNGDMVRAFCISIY